MSNSSKRTASGEGEKARPCQYLERIPRPHGITDVKPQDAQDVVHLSGKVFKLGEEGSGTRPLKTLQDFYDLQEKLLSAQKRLQSPKVLFEDPEFPAEDSSIGSSELVREMKYDIEWKRPHEIVAHPEFFVDGPSRFDIKQGSLLGDCWLLAATSSLAMFDKLLYRVVPKDQNFEEGHYAGIFHFRFWQYGRWVDVVIDDQLPTYTSKTGERKFYSVHSDANDEFWGVLLEKAYAKLHGSYAALDGGFSADAMEDFTGGVSEFYRADDMSQLQNLTYTVLRKARKNNALIGCSFKDQVSEGQRPEGLFSRHAYSITHVTRVRKGIREDEIPLLRLRNPWGNPMEWKGAWSDESPEWESISKEEKNRLQLITKDDGEFWISFDDFRRYYDNVVICHLNPREFSNSPEVTGWYKSEREGAWVRGATAGGREFSADFQCNPQYRISLKEESAVVVALMQENRGRGAAHYLRIGFSIYALKNELKKKQPKPLNFKFFKKNKSINVNLFKSDKSAPPPLQFSKLREVSCRLKLPPGAYCIIPSTDEIGVEGEFLLRVFSEKPNHLSEYDEETAVDPGKGSKPDKSRVEKILRRIESQAGDRPKLDDLRIFFNKMAYDELRINPIKIVGGRTVVEYDGRKSSRSPEFKQNVILYKDINKLARVFKALSKKTKNVKGYLNTLYLRKALNKAGYHLDNQILCKFVKRYSDHEENITCRDFVICALHLKIMFGTTS